MNSIIQAAFFDELEKIGGLFGGPMLSPRLGISRAIPSTPPMRPTARGPSVPPKSVGGLARSPKPDGFTFTADMVNANPALAKPVSVTSASRAFPYKPQPEPDPFAPPR